MILLYLQRMFQRSQRATPISWLVLFLTWGNSTLLRKARNSISVLVLASAFRSCRSSSNLRQKMVSALLTLAFWSCNKVQHVIIKVTRKAFLRLSCHCWFLFLFRDIMQRNKLLAAHSGTLWYGVGGQYCGKGPIITSVRIGCMV